MRAAFGSPHCFVRDKLEAMAKKKHTTGYTEVGFEDEVSSD
jgi:hypothetical protein